jgi:hypothetical protein
MAGMKIEVEITPEMIERALAKLLVEHHYDEDGDVVEHPIDVRAIIRERLKGEVEKHVGKVAREVAESVTRERVEAILDEGFPVYSTWGSKESTKTLRQVVGEALFKTDQYSRDLTHTIRAAMDTEVKRAVGSAVKDYEEQMREAMTSAAAEAMAKYMKKAVG